MSDYLVKYGLEWEGFDGDLNWMDELFIEDYIWLNWEDKEIIPEGITGHDRFYHFKRSIDLKWNRNGKEMFIWTEWNEKMMRSYLDNKVAMWGGAASCGKSYSMAAIALTLFFADPKSVILITSTSIDGARNRVWGAVMELWNSIQEEIGETNMPGVVDDRSGQIKGLIAGSKRRKADSTVGLKIVAFGDKGEAINSVLGTKAKGNHPYLLIYDELSQLPTSLADIWRANVSTQASAKIIAASNPAGTTGDPFASLCEPKLGWEWWEQRQMELDEWETKDGGVFLRFDGYKNPLVVESQLGTLQPDGTRKKATEQRLAKLRKPLNFITIEEYQEKEKTVSKAFALRFFRALFTEGTARMPFIDAKTIEESGIFDRMVFVDTPKRIAAVDPSFTDSGDRSILTIAELGRMPDGRMGLNIVEQIPVKVNPERNRPYSMIQAEEIHKIMDSMKVTPDCLAVDASGSGVTFCDVLFTELRSNAFYRCQSGGKASDKKIAATDTRVARDFVDGRVSELWLAMKSAIISKQLKGNLSKICITELTNRMYDDVGGKFKLERKIDYKRHANQESPDFSDSLAILIDLARTRFGFTIRPASKQFTVPDRMDWPFRDNTPYEIKQRDPWIVATIAASRAESIDCLD